MKSKIRTVNEIVEYEINKQRDKVYSDIAHDVVHQTIACCLLYFEKEHGYRGKRLSDIASGIGAMMSATYFGREIDPTEVIQYMKSTYNIDIDSIQIKIEDKQE